ncbi:unnamed protein product [Dicrocoelium dendriticum]|nr:unnamed protein product [Dicrocoelium dendriticum]
MGCEFLYERFQPIYFLAAWTTACSISLAMDIQARLPTVVTVTLFWLISVQAQTDATISNSTPIIEKFNGSTGAVETRILVDSPKTDTQFEAIAFGLEQFASQNVHGPMDFSEMDIAELPAVVQQYFVGGYKSNRPETLTCWKPQYIGPVEFNDTHGVAYSRSWYVGQSGSPRKHLLHGAGYAVTEVNGELILSNMEGFHYPHEVFTCTLSPVKSRDIPVPTLDQVHQLRKEPLLLHGETVQNGYEGVKVSLELITHTPVDDLPDCHGQPAFESLPVCHEAFWSNMTHPLDFQGGFAVFKHELLDYNPEKDLLRWIKRLVEDFCDAYGCTVVKACFVGDEEKSDVHTPEEDDNGDSQPTTELATDESYLEGEDDFSDSYPEYGFDPRNVRYTSGEIRRIVAFDSEYGYYADNTSSSFVREDKMEAADRVLTARSPGSNPLQINITLQFTSKQHISFDCDSIRRIISPDLGDDRGVHFDKTLDTEPFGMLNRMLRTHEFPWFRSYGETDAEQYRATYCYTGSETFESSTSTRDAFVPSRGFTAIFVLPKDTMSKSTILFGRDDEPQCSIQAFCLNETCTLDVNLQNTIAHNISTTNAFLHGVFALRAEVDEPAELLILVAEPARLSDSDGNQMVQPIMLFRHAWRTSETGIVTNTSYATLECSREKVQIVHEFGHFTTKFLSWPEMELTGPSFSRISRIRWLLERECHQSAAGVMFIRDSVPVPHRIHPNYDQLLNFASSGLPCSSPCEIAHNSGPSARMECITVREKEQCSREFFLPISLPVMDKAMNTRSPVYAALAMQYCNVSYDEVYLQTNEEIMQMEADRCNFTKGIQSHTHEIFCPTLIPIIGLRMDPVIFSCVLEKKEVAFPSLSTMRTKVRSRITRCETIGEKVESSASRVTRLCPLGHRVTWSNVHSERTVDWSDSGEIVGTQKTYDLKQVHGGYTCVPCEPNTYNDFQDSPFVCNACPSSKPSTYTISGAISSHCSNAMINVIRKSILHNGTVVYEAKLNGTAKVSPRKHWWKTHYPSEPIDYLDKLKPSEEYLIGQRQAIDVFKALTQLTFSETELTIMVAIAFAVAVFGITSGLLVLAAITPSVKCKATLWETKESGCRERRNRSVYCFLRQMLLEISTLYTQTRRRTSKAMQQVEQMIQQSDAAKAVREAAENAGIKLKKVLYGEKLEHMTLEQLDLIDLLTQITLERIVEQAKKEIAQHRRIKQKQRSEYKKWLQHTVDAEGRATEAEAEAAAARADMRNTVKRMSEAGSVEERLDTRQQLEAYRQYHKKMTAVAAKERAVAGRLLSEVMHMQEAEQKANDPESIGLSEHDRRAIECAAPELRPYLRLPRYHTPAYFLLHASNVEDERRRRTEYPAPPKVRRHSRR